MKPILLPSVLALLLSVAAAHAAAPREDTSLDANWRFLRQDVPAASAPAFDDSAWEKVTLPHTWNAQDGQDGGSNYYRGPAWYRTHLAVTPAAGKSYFLQFDGAALVADVFLNGKPVGTHAGGFQAFCFDITPLLNPTGDNVLAVKVNNARDPRVAPLAGDFTIFGGLYRHVHLLTRNNFSIAPIDDGIASPGIYLKQSNVSADKADVEATINIMGGPGAPKGPVTIQWTLLDADHKALQTGAVGVNLTTVNAGTLITSPSEATAKFSIDRPHLWNGIQDPYMYSVQIDVKSGDTILDSDTQPLGLRFFRVDPDKGFFLNGRPYSLHGVNRHQDRLDKGWAISRADMEEDYRLIAGMGCTAVRLAHYQHDQYFYDLCDRGGMAVWAELCLVNDIDLAPEFAQISKQQLTELIKQNYNHPGIFFWSIYNEQHMAVTDQPRLGLVSSLNALARQLDSTRLTVGASDRPPAHPITLLTDLTAYNRYDGWYTGAPEAWPATLDTLRQALPARAYSMSEYGAGASVIQHQENPPKPTTTARWHPEEWQCLVHEAAWKALAARPYIWGTFLWNFADFGVDSRSEGDTLGRNDKGLVTYDRKIKKDAYYFYQATWTPPTTMPMVHINLPEKLPYSPTQIKVYSNCDAVELFADGKSLGTKLAPDHIFIWNSLKLPAQGAVKIAADGKTAKTAVDLTIDPAMPDPFRPKP